MILSDNVIENLVTSSAQQDFFDPSFTEKGSFGVRVNKGGTRTFFMIYARGGYRKRVTIGRFPEYRYKEARSRAVSLLRRIALSERLPIPTIKENRTPNSSGKALCSRPLEHISLSSLSDIFLTHCQLTKKSAKTIHEYERLLNKEVLPHLGNFDHISLKKLHMQELLEDIALRRDKVILANRVRSLLMRLFNFAIDRELRQTNPLSQIRPFIVKRKQNEFLPLIDLRRLYFHLKSKTSISSKAVLLSLCTGQSLSKVLNSRFSDFRPGFWSQRTKKNQTIFLSINEIAESIISSEIDTRGAKGKTTSDYLFISHKGERLKYLEKSIRLYGQEIGLKQNLTAGLLKESLINTLKDYAINFNPSLNDNEINEIKNPDKIYKEKSKRNTHEADANHDLSISLIRGHHCSKAIQILLEGGIDDRPKSNESNNAAGFEKDSSQVIFVPKHRWGEPRNKPPR